MLALLLLTASAACAVHAGIFNPTPVSDLVLAQGYPYEENKVVTEDGYILTLQRIPYGRRGGPGGQRPPVLLQHGLLCSAACWVIGDPAKALGFVLADAGYDVWMGNSRGNTYSNKHLFLDASKDAKRFWDFSFHEMGYYDLPAAIDHILGRTNASRVSYVGHSQGTSQFFVMASTRPEYNDKVSVMSALAPIAFLDGARGSVHFLTKLTGALGWILSHLGIYKVHTDNIIMRTFDKTVCRKTAITRPLCDNLLFLIAGFDSKELNVSLVPSIVDIAPEDTAVKQLTHYGQLATEGRVFQQYDYGLDTNLAKYGVKDPPKYHVEKITTPIILHYSDNDLLAGVEDVEYLYDHLINSNGKMKVEVPLPKFNHLDFMWAVDVNELLYNKMIQIMNKFNHI